MMKNKTNNQIKTTKPLHQTFFANFNQSKKLQTPTVTIETKSIQKTTNTTSDNPQKTTTQPEKQNLNKDKPQLSHPELFYAFKFRPSSHSDNYSLVATFHSKAEATKAQKAVKKLLEDMSKHLSTYDVDWSPEEAELSICDREITFEVYTAGYLNAVEATLNNAKPESLDWQTNHQELKITVSKLPKDLTLQTVPLVLDKEEAEAIKWLVDNVGSPQVILSHTKKGSEQTFVWYYAGSEIYADSTLYVNFEFSVYQKDNWTIEEI